MNRERTSASVDSFQANLYDVYTERQDAEAAEETAALNRAAAAAVAALLALPTGLLLGMRQLAEAHRG